MLQQKSPRLRPRPAAPSLGPGRNKEPQLWCLKTEARIGGREPPSPGAGVIAATAGLGSIVHRPESPAWEPREAQREAAAGQHRGERRGRAGLGGEGAGTARRGRAGRQKAERPPWGRAVVPWAPSDGRGSQGTLQRCRHCPRPGGLPSGEPATRSRGAPSAASPAAHCTRKAQAETLAA